MCGTPNVTLATALVQPRVGRVVPASSAPWEEPHGLRLGALVVTFSHPERAKASQTVLTASHCVLNAPGGRGTLLYADKATFYNPVPWDKMLSFLAVPMSTRVLDGAWKSSWICIAFAPEAASFCRARDLLPPPNRGKNDVAENASRNGSCTPLLFHGVGHNFSCLQLHSYRSEK